MSSFHELSWPTKALSAGAMLAMVLSLTGCPSPDATTSKTGSETPPVTDDGILVTAVSSDRVFFEYDSAELRPDAQATLGEIGAWLVKHPNTNVTIEGHCDERGTREYNLALGERRANAGQVLSRQPRRRCPAASRRSAMARSALRRTAATSSAWAQDRAGGFCAGELRTFLTTQ